MVALAAGPFLVGCEQRVGPAAPPASPHASSAGGAGRLVDGAVGFSIDIPEDFVAQSLSGVQSKVLSGPTLEGVTVNVNVIAERFSGSIDEYCSAAGEYARRELPEAMITKPGPFAVDAGLPARRWTMIQTMNGTRLAQEQFAVAASGKVFVITCTRAEADRTDWKPVFERCARSFRPE